MKFKKSVLPSTRLGHEMGGTIVTPLRFQFKFHKSLDVIAYLQMHLLFNLQATILPLLLITGDKLDKASVCLVWG